MPYDPTIALRVAQPQFDPATAMQNALAIRNAQQAGQLNQLKLQQEQQAMQEAAGLQSYLAQNPDLTSADVQNRLVSQYGQKGLDILNTRQELANRRLQGKTQELAYNKAHHDEVNTLIGDVTKYTSADQARSALDSLLEQGKIDTQTHGMYSGMIASTPWPQAKTQILGGLRSIQEQFESMQPQEPKLGTYQPGDYTIESWAKFEKTKNPADLRYKPTASATAAQDDRNTVAFRETADDGTVTMFNKYGEQIGTTKGKKSATVVKTEVARTQLGKDLDNAIYQLTEASKPGGLIDQSTGSGIGKLVDVGAGFFGGSTAGSRAIASMAPIYDLVLKMIPRFEGPQSDKDTMSYNKAAGQLADPSTPTGDKKAAAATILNLMKARRNQFTTKEATDAGVTSTAGGADVRSQADAIIGAKNNG